MVELLRLQEVFIRMKEAGLNKVEPHKYCLFPQHVSYLGHLVSDGGISTDISRKDTRCKGWNLRNLRNFLYVSSSNDFLI